MFHISLHLHHLWRWSDLLVHYNICTKIPNGKISHFMVLAFHLCLYRSQDHRRGFTTYYVIFDFSWSGQTWAEGNKYNICKHKVDSTPQTVGLQHNALATTPQEPALFIFVNCISEEDKYKADNISSWIAQILYKSPMHAEKSQNFYNKVYGKGTIHRGINWKMHKWSILQQRSSVLVVSGHLTKCKINRQ